MRKWSDLAPRSRKRVQNAMLHRPRTFLREGGTISESVPASTSDQREAGGDQVVGHEASGDPMHWRIVCTHEG